MTRHSDGCARYLITRKWIVEAMNSDEAIRKSKNWCHSYIRIKRLKE